jgi:hypothetical protein
MSNYKTWNVRKRHEWLAKPLKKERVKRRSARRVGLLDAWMRSGKGVAEAAPAEAAAEAKE